MDISKSIISMVQENLIKILSLRKDFEEKEDGSFVSKADYFLQDLLINKITSYFPNYFIFS